LHFLLGKLSAIDDMGTKRRKDIAITDGFRRSIEFPFKVYLIEHVRVILKYILLEYMVDFCNLEVGFLPVIPQRG
jgi:hypothetical protein